MSTKKEKKEMAVAALCCGTVIDHIPADSLFKAVRVLGLENMDKNITIGYNLESRKLGRKGIIKVADTEFAPDIIDRIALIAPTAVVNIVRDYEVVEKRPVKLPESVTNIVKCPNPKCISNNEPMNTKFMVVNDDNNEILLTCHYCNRTIQANKIRML